MLKTNAFLIHFLRVCLVFVVFILFLTLPQINIAGYIQPTISSKFIYFLYGCLALLGFYILNVVSTKTISFSFSKLDIALFVLVSYFTINRYFIQLHFGFSIRYMELLGLSFLYVVLRRLSIKNYPWLLLAIIISGMLQAVYGNLQLLGYYSSNHSGFKMTGSFFNPGPYAGFLVSVWSVALGMYLYKDKIIAQLQSNTKNRAPFYNEFIKYAFEYIPLLGLVSIAIVLPATQSRAAWIAAISSSLVLVEFRYANLNRLFKKINRLKRTLLIVLSIVIISAGLFGVYHFKKGSSDGRAFIWKRTTEMIADTPVFGVGFDRFKAHYMNYQAHYFAIKGETPEAMVADNTYYTFNEWLQFVAENGLLGFVFLMMAILVLFKIKVKEENKYWILIAKSGLLAIGVFACFSYPMQILPIKLVLVFLVTMLSNSDANNYQLKIGKDKKRQWLFKTVLVLLAFVCMNKTISYTQKLSQGFMAWNNDLNNHLYGDYKTAVLEFETVYPLFEKEGDFLMNYGKTLAIAGEYTKAIVVLEQAKYYLNTTIMATALGDSYKATKQYKKAEVAYQQAANMIPSQFYPNYLLVKLYDDTGQKAKAIAMAKKVLKKKIKIPSTAIKEIQAEMKRILAKHKNPLGFKN